jgi:hypothetical protein
MCSRPRTAADGKMVKSKCCFFLFFSCVAIMSLYHLAKYRDMLQPDANNPSRSNA